MKPNRSVRVLRSMLLPTLLLSLIASVTQASDPEPLKPCTIFSPVNGAYYDLNSITVQPLINHKKAHKDDRDSSWHAKGYDYGTNFTVNICAPVIEGLEDVIGVDKPSWRNVSAFYKYDGKTYSIGYVLTATSKFMFLDHSLPNTDVTPTHREQSSELVFRGRKLVLNYTSGSPCDAPSTKNPRSLIDDDGDKKKHDDDNKKDHDDDKSHDKDQKSDTRRKSTVILFQCERDSLAPKAHLSFVGASEDECTYFFEAKSMAACGGVNETEQSLGPGGVFGVMYAYRRKVYCRPKS